MLNVTSWSTYVAYVLMKRGMELLTDDIRVETG